MVEAVSDENIDSDLSIDMRSSQMTEILKKSLTDETIKNTIILL